MRSAIEATFTLAEAKRDKSRSVLRKPYPELIRFRDAMSLMAFEHTKAISADGVTRLKKRRASEAFINTKSTLRPYGAVMSAIRDIGDAGAVSATAPAIFHLGACYPHLHRVAGTRNGINEGFRRVSDLFQGNEKGVSRESK